MQEEEEEQTLLATNELAAGVKHENVYITPSHIEFTEAIEGATYRRRITIKNIGIKSAFIRIRQPNSIVNIFPILIPIKWLAPLDGKILL